MTGKVVQGDGVRDTAVQEIANERDPLVSGPNTAMATKPVSYSELPKKKQLAILCLVRLADPLAATAIQVCFCLTETFSSITKHIA